jgi:hypothetical protein
LRLFDISTDKEHENSTKPDTAAIVSKEENNESEEDTNSSVDKTNQIPTETPKQVSRVIFEINFPRKKKIMKELRSLLLFPQST